MKKFYNDPSMNISLFEETDVITTSGGTVDKTAAVNAAKNYLGNQNVNGTANLVLSF